MIDPTPPAPLTDPAAVPSPEPVKTILRDQAPPDGARGALVRRLLADIAEAKKHHEPAFKIMREDMKFVAGYQVQGKRPTDNRVQVNFVQKHVNDRVADLYAKNPVFTASRRKRLDFAIWDGQEASLAQAAQAMAAAQATGQPPDPQTMALLKDVADGVARRHMLDSVGQTLEVLFDFAIDEQVPKFKVQLKQLVRRTQTCGVGYIKPGYQRELQKRPDEETRLPDITDRVANIERLQEEASDEEAGSDSSEAERLKVAQAAMQAEPDVIVREGLIFDFPASTRIIPDLKTRQLTGWVGSDWVAEMFLYSPEEIEETYQIDIGSSYTGYTVGQYGVVTRSDKAAARKACVYEVYHRKDGVVYTLCEGYPDFLTDPTPPEVFIDQFFPWYPLAFNGLESEDDLFPQSDVRLLRSVQLETNRSLDALRQHRIANRPLYVGQKGKLENKELKNLAEAAAHELIMLQGLDSGEKIENVIQELRRAGIDPNLYETADLFNMVRYVVGVSEPDVGNMGDSATQSSIAESARVSSTASNSDDLDDCLSSVARASGGILLREMSKDTVVNVVGPGAVWPEMSREQIAEQIYLEIEAGSSGRPNSAAETAKFERLAPILVQIPGISPAWLAQYAIKTLDAKLDYEDAILSNFPSIVAQNALAGRQIQPGTGNPATDPAAQGGAGANNAPNHDVSAGGPQAAHPTPHDQAGGPAPPAGGAPVAPAAPAHHVSYPAHAPAVPPLPAATAPPHQGVPL